MDDEAKDQRITHLDEKKGIYKEKLDIGSDSYEGICNKLRETCVDPFFEDRYWRIDKIELIKNKRLENGYNEMKAAMGYEDLDSIQSREVFLFSGGTAKICDDICKDGHRTGLKKRPVLGHIGQGVHFVQHYDILTRYLAFLQFKSSVFVVVYKAILGRAKKVDVYDSKVHDEPAIPDANFNCFVCEKQVQPQMAISDAMDRSFVYIYDFDKSSNPVKHPRQTLPYGLVTLERKPCVKLSTPFLAVESGGSDVRWEVQGETRRGFRWNVTKGASTRSLREKVDQVRRRRSLSKDKKHHHLPVTEECPPVLNRFDIEHRTKVKKRKTGDVEPPVLNEDGKLDNMIREIGSKKNRILQIKLQRGSKSSVSNASKEKSVDIWNIVKNSESEDTLCSLEPHEYVSKQCVNKDPIDKLPNAEDRKVTDSVIDKKELNSSKYAKDPTDKVTNAGGRKLPQLVTETNRSDLYEFDEDTMDKLSNDEGRQIPESVTETKESDSSERDLISIGSTDVAGNSFVPDYNHFKTHSYHKHSTIPKTMKPFINLTRIDSKTKHPNKLKVSNSSDKTTDDKQSTVRTPGADHQRQNKFDDGKFENNSMTKSKHEKETTKSKETTSNKLGRDKNESDPILEHDAIYQTQAQACDSLPNATADFCSGNTQTNVPNSSNIPLDSANGYTKETKTDNNHTKVVNDTKRLNRPVSLGDAKQTVEAKNKTTVNSVKINKTKSGKQNDESKSNTKRLEKDAETLKLPKTKNSDMSNTSRVAQENLSHSVLKSLLKGQSAIDTTKGNLLHNKNGHSGKTSENTEKTKPKANKCSFEDQLSKIDSLLLNRKIQSLDSEHLAAKKKENTSVLSPLQKQTVQVANINMKIPIIKDDNDHITPMTQDKHQQDQITSNCDTTDKVVRNSRNTISSKKSRPKGRSKSDTDKWKSFDITVIMKRRNSFQETTNDTKHINSAKTVSNDNYPSKATTAVVAKNKNPSHEINKKVVPGHLPEVKLAKDTTHKIITNKLQCDYLAALKLGPAVTNKKKTANNVHKSVKQIGVVIKKKSLDIKNTPAHHVMEVVTEKQIDSQKVSKMDTNEFYNIMVDHVTENVQKTTIQNISKKTHIVDERQTVHTVLNTGGCGSNSAVSPSSIPNLGKSVSPPAGTEAPCMLNATPNVPSACKNTSLIERNRNNHSKDTANKDKIKSGSYDKAHTVVTSTYNTQLTNNAPSFKNCSSGNQREYSGKNRQDILLNEASKTLVNSRKVFKSSSITDHGSLHNSKKIHEVQPSVSLVGNRPDMKASVLKNHKADQNIQLKQKSGSDHVKRSSNDKTQLKQQTSITGTPATKVDAETAKRLQRFLQKSINQVHQKKLLASDTQGIQGSGGKSDIRSDSNIKGVLSKTSTVPADCETIFEKTNDSVLKKLDIVKSRAQTIIPTCVSDVANVPQKNTNVASGINNTANDSIPETMNRPTLRRSDSTETVIGGINDLTVASSFRSPLDEFSDSQNSLVPEIKCENINKSPNDQPLDLTMPKVNYEIITYPLDLTKRKSDVSEKAEENSAVNERAENNSVSKSETTVSDEIDHSKNEKDSVTSCENTLSVKNENMSAVPSTKDTQSEITKTLHQLSQVLQEISKLSEEKVPTPDDETLSLKSDIQQNEKELTTKIGPTNQNPLNTVNVTEEDTSFDKTVNNNKNIPEAQLHDQLQKTIKPESSTEDVSNSQGHNMEKQNLQTQDLQAMRDLYMSADESDNDVKIFGDDSNSNSNSLNLLKIRERHNEMQKRNVETQNIESKTVRDDQLNNTALKNKMGSEGSHCTGKVEKVSEIKTALPLRQMHVKSEPETDVFMEANTSDPQVKKTDLILSDKIDDIISIASVKKEPLDVESNTMVETSSVLDKNKSDSAIDTIPNNKERNWFSTSSENVTTDMVGNEVKPDTECVISRSLHDIVNIAEKSDTDPDEFVKSQNNSKTNKPNINDKNKVKSQTPQRKESAAISPTQIKVSTLQSAETAEKYQKANVLPRHDSVLPHQKPTLSKQTVLFNDNTQNSENGKLGLHKADDNVVQKFPIGHSSFDTKGCTFNREYPLVCDVHGKADVGLLETFGIPFNMKVAAQVDTRQTHIREPKTEAKPEESTKKASEEINKSYIATESTHSIKSETPIQRQSSVSSIHKRKHVYGSQKGWLNKDGKFISGIKKPKKDKEIHYLTLTKNITLEPPKVNRERKEKELPENNCIESEKATDKEFVALCIDELLKSERRKSNTYSLPNTDEINKQTNVPKIQNLHDENHPHVISDKPISEHIISKPESKQEEEKNENKLCSPIKELCSPNKENKALRSESIEKSAISPIAANKPKDPSIKTFEELKQWKWRNRPYFRNRPFTYNKARRYQFHNSGIKRNQLFLNTYGFKNRSDRQPVDRALDMNAKTDHLVDHVIQPFKFDSENTKLSFGYHSKEQEGNQKDERKSIHPMHQSNAQEENQIHILQQEGNKEKCRSTFNDTEKTHTDQNFSDDFYNGFDAFKYRPSAVSDKTQVQAQTDAEKKLKDSSIPFTHKRPAQKRLKSVCQTLEPNAGNLRQVSKRVLTEDERKVEREKATREIEEAIRHLRRTYEGTWEDMSADSKVASFLEKMTEKLAVIQIKRTKIEEERQKWLPKANMGGNTYRKWPPRVPWKPLGDGGPWKPLGDGFVKRFVPYKRNYQHKENSMQDMKETLRKEVEKIRRELTERFINKLGNECTLGNEKTQPKSGDTNTTHLSEDNPRKVQKSSSKSEERKGSEDRRVNADKEQTNKFTDKRFERHAADKNENYSRSPQKGFKRRENRFNFIRNRTFHDTKFNNNWYKSKWWHQNDRGRFSKCRNNQSSRETRGRSVNKYVTDKQTADNRKPKPGSNEDAIKNVSDNNTREAIEETKHNDLNSRRSRSSNGSGHRDRTSNYDDGANLDNRECKDTNARSNRSHSHKSYRSHSKESCETYERYHKVGSNPDGKYNKDDEIKTDRESNERSKINGKTSNEYPSGSDNETALDTIRNSYDSDTDHKVQHSSSQSDRERSRRSSPRSDKHSYITSSSQSDRDRHKRSSSKERNKSAEYKYDYGAYYQRRNEYRDSGRNYSKDGYINNNEDSKRTHSGDRKRFASNDRSEPPEKRLKVGNDSYERNDNTKLDSYRHKADAYHQNRRRREHFTHKFSNNYQQPYWRSKDFNRTDNFQNRPFYKRGFRQEFKKRF